MDGEAVAGGILMIVVLGVVVVFSASALKQCDTQLATQKYTLCIEHASHAECAEFLK